MKIERAWENPRPDTFSSPAIGDLIGKYLSRSKKSVDPFAGDKTWATFTNDLNPKTKAEYHWDAVYFLNVLAENKGLKDFDLLLFDPPYSPRQISDCYLAAGIKAEMIHTQNGRLYAACRDAAMKILAENAIVISCGWNSTGMGRARGFEIKEILLVCHGGAHNDTIVTVERRVATLPGIF